MKKTFPYDDDAAGEGIFGPRANAGNWTDAGDNFPLAVFAGTATNGATGNAAAVATIPQLADWLVNGFWSYQGTNAHHWASTTISYNINGLNAAEKFLTQSAMQAWHEIANLTFVQTTGSANITFIDSGSMTAVTYANWTTSGVMTSATVDISSDWITNDGGAMDGKTGIDSYGYQTYIHEIGHALGLGHQGPYNGSASYSTNAIFADDTWQYSIMSYFSENNYSGSTYRYVVTPQMADIYAADQIYGVASTRTGNTTYGFHSNAGSIFDFTQYGTAPALTIYDSGGNDTLDCSGYSSSQTIDLHPGAFSSIGGLVHNIGISTGTVIENAVGGNGNDTLIANDFGCTLSGGAGNDTLVGGAGNDRLIGGIGADRMTGNGGSDTFVFATGDSTSSQPDLITDFISGVDSVDLSAFDAITATSALDQFYFVGTAAFNGTAGVLGYFYNSSLGITVLQGDTNGDNVADFVLDFTGNIALSLVNLIGASGTPPKPDLSEYIAVDKTTVAVGGNITIDAYDMNLGNAGSSGSIARIYVSTDPNISTSDTLLATIATTGTLAVVSQPGYYDHQTVTVTLPDNLAPGTYYIGGIADYSNQVIESNEANNTYNVVAITVTAPLQPDLIEYVAVDKTTVGAGGSITIDAYDMNIGNGVSVGSTAKIYLSADPTISGSDTVLATLTTSASLAAVGQSGYYDHQTVTVNLPDNLAPGTYYVGGIADYNNQVGETNEANNTYNVIQVTVIPPPQPDLSEFITVDKTSVGVGGSIIIDTYDMNLGNVVSGGSMAQIYLSTDATITTSDTVLATLTTTGPLATVGQPGYYDHQTVTVNLPGNLAPGTYYIGGIADYNNQVGETNEANNTYNVIQVTVIPPPQPDLSEFIAIDKTSVTAGGSITIDAYDMNLGNAVSGGSTAQIYLSTDATITTSDAVLATLTTTGPLATVSQPGYYDHQTITVNLPGNLAPGIYYIGGIADYNNHVGESNEGNNTYNVVQLTVTSPSQSGAPQPDLSEYVAVDKTSVNVGGSITIDAYDMNLGNAVSGGSTAQIYLSTDANITTSDVVLATLTTVGPLATVSQPGYYDHQTFTVSLPGNLAPGTYYIGGIADYNNHVGESNEGNNTYNVVQITVPAPQAPISQNLIAPPGNDTFIFIADLGAGSANSSVPETFEFNGVAAAAAGHHLASLYNSAAAETQYLQHLVAGDHDAVAYFANLEGASPADIQVTQTQHGFIIHLAIARRPIASASCAFQASPAIDNSPMGC